MLLHEQSRTDCDDYVVINKDNIEVSLEHNLIPGKIEVCIGPNRAF